MRFCFDFLCGCLQLVYSSDESFEQSILDSACIVVPYWIRNLERFEFDRASVGLVAFLLSSELIVLG
jgi:hypothetical protein